MVGVEAEARGHSQEQADLSMGGRVAGEVQPQHSHTYNIRVKSPDAAQTAE
jgi:hypothetical protein